MEHAVSASSDILARVRALICIASISFCRAHDDSTHGQIYLEAMQYVKCIIADGYGDRWFGLARPS